MSSTGIWRSDFHGFSGEAGRRSPDQVTGHETVTVNPLIACRDCAACAAGREQSCARRRIIGVDPDIVSAETAEWVEQASEVLSRPIDGRVDIHGAPAAFTELARGGSPSSKVLVFPSWVPPGTSSPAHPLTVPSLQNPED